MVKAECQKRDSKRPYKALTNTSLRIEQSKFLFENDDTLIPVGSGICGKCRTELLKRMEVSKESTGIMPQNMCSVEIDPDPEKGTYHMEDARSEQSDQEQAHMDCGEQDELSISETISELSQYSEWQDSQESPGRKKMQH